MSRKTYIEAMESVLKSEMDAREDLLVFRVGAVNELAAAPVESDREILLPHMGTMAFSMAMGAAMAGMHPVLDLRSQPAHGMMLLDALCELPAGKLPEMTVITGTEDIDMLTDLPGVLSLCPKTPRQAAGFTRAAIRSDKLSVLMTEEALYEAEDDVPEESDFVMLPLDGLEAPGVEPDAAEESSAADPEENGAEKPTAQETAEPAFEAEDEPAEPEESAATETPAIRPTFCATRMLPCDLGRLRALSEELGADPAALAGRCALHVSSRCPGFEWHYEAEAMEGECAFLPPKNEKVSVWLGWDRLTAAYEAEKVAQGEAAALLRALKRVIEKPTLLIYDREDEER